MRDAPVDRAVDDKVRNARKTRRSPVRRVVGRVAPSPLKRALGHALRLYRRRVLIRFDLLLPEPPPGSGPPIDTVDVASAGRARLARRPTLRIEAPKRMHVARALEARGLADYQSAAIAVFLAAVEWHPGRVAVDIGANIGVFSLVAEATVGTRVVGFEPTPEIALRFEALARRNRLCSRVETIALGASTGVATLYLSDQTSSSNSLRRGFRQARDAITVPIERLDDYCARSGIRPAVLKVDTEATEPEVLAGGRRLLETDHPWIVCEVLAGRTEAALEAILGPLGYRWFALGGEEVVRPVAALRGDATHGQLDWLFVPGTLPRGFADRARAWRRQLEACRPG